MFYILINSVIIIDACDLPATTSLQNVSVHSVPTSISVPPSLPLRHRKHLLVLLQLSAKCLVDLLCFLLVHLIRIWM